MSIASDLEKTTIRLLHLLDRNSTEVLTKGPELVEELYLVIDRIRGLESEAIIQPQGGQA